MKLLLSLSSKSIILYHASPDVFDEFSEKNLKHGVVFLTGNQARAKRWGKVAYTVEVQYNGIQELNASSMPEDYTDADFARIIAGARSRLFDMIHIKRFNDHGKIGDMYFALNPENIKILHRSK